MTTKLISFRLTDDAIAALELHKQKGESINLTAQRLLTDRLGVAAKISTTTAERSALAVNNIVDNVVNSDRFAEVLGDKLASIITSQNGKNAEIEQSVEELKEAVQQLTALVHNPPQNGVVHSSEAQQPHAFIYKLSSAEPESFEQDYGADVEDDINEMTTLTSDKDADAIADEFPGTEPTVEDAIAAEQPSTPMLGEVQMAERLDVAPRYLRKKVKDLGSAQAFTDYYRKKTREDNIRWDYTGVGGAFQFHGVKEVEILPPEKPQQLALSVTA